jgi:transposase
MAGANANVREVLNGIFYILWTGCQWSTFELILGYADR